MTPETKVFVQLAPDPAGVQQLLHLQETLVTEKTARLIKMKALHLTIIHIGKLQRIVEAVHPVTGMSVNEILRHATIFVDEAVKLLAPFAGQKILLKTRRTSLFGANAFVCLFAATAELNFLHRQSLLLLEEFLQRCGVGDTAEFMAADQNLRHALTLNPHVTLAKFPATEFLEFPQVDINFLIMPVAYEAA